MATIVLNRRSNEEMITKLMARVGVLEVENRNLHEFIDSLHGRIDSLKLLVDTLSAHQVREEK